MSSPNLKSHLNELSKFETHFESLFGETWTPRGPYKHLGAPKTESSPKGLSKYDFIVCLHFVPLRS